MDKKLILSKSLTLVFAGIVVTFASAGSLLVDLVCEWYELPRATLGSVLLWSGYGCAALAIAALYAIYGLLSAIAKGEVFSAFNVRRLRTMSALCAAAGGVALVDCFVTRLFFLGMIGIGSLFMGLLVRVVGDAFDRALRMKGELDFTI